MIDINADIGESYGAYTIGNDKELLQLISSCNIACGFHAGDPDVMRETIELAIKQGVNIGAHPGYADLHGFGRRHIPMTHESLFNLMLYQVSALKGMVEAMGGKLHHVKPHGALYNDAARDEGIAQAIVKAIAAVDNELKLFGLSGSLVGEVAADIGLEFVHEVFLDRRYQSDGSLVPRSNPQAVIHDQQEALQQLEHMLHKGVVDTIEGKQIPIKAETLCIHGDHPESLSFAKAVVMRLTR
ncbi:5-oxoprolinase subunit PxpA [Algivirga pacifica]|uniref:5-oxoprolinase subunit A n=1 Tax=Algivirga pacifica TaxID=1162670 RepID=A0ABP9DP20_9BACT